MLFPADASDLLSRIPMSARTILDVGCGSGAIASAYRRVNPRARLLGLDADPVAVERAAAHLDQVVVADPETDPLPFNLPEGIDCIIYNDILEHLRDPWALIRRHAAALGPDGMMLIRVANIEYWRPVERLLRGPSENEQVRRPHPTRPHGFTMEFMRDNLTEAGLVTCDVTMREPDREAAARFASCLAPGLEALGVAAQDYVRRAGPSHLIWRVRRGTRQRLVLAGSMLAPVGGVSHVRVVYPIQAMATDPTVTASVTERVEIGQPEDDTARIFVLHRPALIGEQGHALLRRLTEAGYLIVTEFDDLPDHFEMMRMGGALSFYGAHAVQTSTIAMAEALRPHNPEIAVFPNAVGSLPDVGNFADPNAVTVFFGALNREPDWSPLMPAINAVAGMAGPRVTFQVVHDQAFFDALKTPHKTFTPTCDHETYLRIMGESEICLMPLSDTPFNRAKSDLKFIEAASWRVASLASSVVYGNSIADGQTGLLFRDPVEFHERLQRLVAMPELARELAEAARRYVIDHRMLAYQVAARIAWYRSLWARRETLSDARRARMMRYQLAA